MSAIIKSPFSDDLATIDTTSKALRGSHYGTNVTYGRFQRATYSASVTAKVSISSGLNYCFQLSASGRKVIRPIRIMLQGVVATAAIYGDAGIWKLENPLMGGTLTLTALTPIPFDSMSPLAEAVVNQITAEPSATETPPAQELIAQMRFMPLTGTVARGVGVFDFDFRRMEEGQVPTITGQQTLALTFNTATTNTVTATFFAQWSESLI